MKNPIWPGALLPALLAIPPIAAQTEPPAPPESVTENSGKAYKLSPFVVLDEKDKGYQAQETLVGSRSGSNVLDIPSGIDIITAEQISDLNATSLREALEYTGVTPQFRFVDNVDIRGFGAATLRDGELAKTFRPNPLYDLDRVEVIKGPAAMLLGNITNLGGAVNMISRKPTDNPRGDAEATFSNHSYVRLVANSSGPLLNTGEMSVEYRVTIGGLEAQRAKAIEKMDEKFYGGALTFNLGPNTSLLLNGYYYQDGDSAVWNDFLDINAPFKGNLQEAKLNRYSTLSFSPGRPQDVFWHANEAFFDATFLTRLSENGNLRAFYFFNNLRDRRRFLTGSTVAADDYTLNRIVTDYGVVGGYSNDGQIDYLHVLPREKFTLSTTLGIDGTQQYFRQDQSAGPFDTPPPIDTRSPNFSNDSAFFAIPRPGAGLPNTAMNASQTLVFSYYFQENLSLFKNRLILIGGFRFIIPGGNSYDYTHNPAIITELNPTKYKVHKFGAVVKLLPRVSAYFSNAQNIIVQNDTVDLFHGGDQLGRLHNAEGNCTEWGLKWDQELSPNISIYGSADHYYEEQTNVKISFVFPDGSSGSTESAKNTSSGVEGNLGVHFKFQGGYSDLVATSLDSESSAAASPGLQIAGYSPRKYTLLGKYTWTNGTLKGLMLGGGWAYQSPKRGGAFLVITPPLANVFASYSWGPHWKTQLNLNNVTDRRYIVAVVQSGEIEAGDTFQAEGTMRFVW